MLSKKISLSKKNGLEDALFYINKKIQFYKERYEQDKKEYSHAKGYLETKKILLDRAVKVKKMLKDVNPDDIDIDINNGQLYEVDIPEDDVMLDEDLPISKQPKKVQEALEDLFFDEFGVIMNNSKSITEKRDTLRISIRDKYREIDKLENEIYPFEKRTVEQQIEIEDKQEEYRKLQRIYNCSLE